MMQKRTIYLSTMPVEEAMEKYRNALSERLSARFETICVRDALDRVTETAVYAKCCSPLYNAAAMDGVAVQAEHTKEARENYPVILRDYIAVDTGDPVNPPFDAVIMAEDSIEREDGSVEIRAAVPPWHNIRAVGEDIVTGEMLIPSKHIVSPMDIGVLLSGGITEIAVYTKPSAAIIPTGTEIIAPGTAPFREGAIIESNGSMLLAMVRCSGGDGLVTDIIPDDYERLKDAVYKASQKHDMVLVIAGSSAGREDYTASVVRELGTVIVHGVAMKPGKPVILGIINTKPVIGIPGYSVSAFLAFKNFAAPLVRLLSGLPNEEGNYINAVASKRMVSSLKHREYVRVNVGKVENSFIASPLARGAGAAMSLVKADGFCIIPQHSEGIEAGEVVSIELYHALKAIEHTLVAIGSHDLMLDIINDAMSGLGYALSSAHVGSQSGVIALKRGECHIAPLHILDEETGEYNRAYIKKMFLGEKASLIKGVGRIQGLMVKKGNPLHIYSIADIVRCRYVNRQRGAGTRILLDYLLKQAGIQRDDIRGYTREAATHTAVAAAVKSESADAGLGIASAAAALELDFIPLGTEEYDFAVRERSLDLPQTAAFLAVLRSDEFRRRVSAIGGYTIAQCGEVVPI